MKLICTVSVSSRLLPTLAINAKKKGLKSTVALCQHPKSDKYYLILFSGQDKNGAKYDLRQNIEKVLTKFVNEGKATIQFKKPPHDLFIQAEVIPLKGFLHLMQRILNGSISSKEMSCSSLSVTPVSTKNIAPTKLVIQNRSEYPMKGFPRTLESLSITKIRRSALDLGILKLSRLRILNLSENCISTLPEEFGQMLSLQVLDISSNEFYKSSKRNWKWIGGNLCKTLQSLNISNNQLVFLPDSVIKLQNLNSLNLSENRLETLPTGIGRLGNLKELKFSHNLIEELPGSIRKLNLQVIDISNNRFRDYSQIPPYYITKVVLPVLSLKECAAQQILDLKLPYDSTIIPVTLVNFLDHEAKYCICGKPCFSVYLHRNATLRLTTVAETVITSSDNIFAPYIPINCYFCSSDCMRIYQRSRAPLIR